MNDRDDSSQERDYVQEVADWMGWYVMWEDQIPKAARDALERRIATADSRRTPLVITPIMARMLLDAADAHIEGDWNEVYHQIRIFAHETTDDIYDSWKAIKEIASADQRPTEDDQ